MLLIFFSHFLLTQFTFAVSPVNLIAVIQVFRHGQRIPFRHFPNDPYKDPSHWPVEPGEITNLGKLQNYLLGKFTRDRYDGFLSKAYNKNDFIAMTTTDTDRVHISAQCTLSGMFEPTNDTWSQKLNWQPIPVRVADNILLPLSPNCAIYEAEFRAVPTKVEEYVLINEKNKELYKKLSKYSGMNVTSVRFIQGLYENLKLIEQFGHKLPDWAKEVYPEPLRNLAGLHWAANSYTDLQKKLGSGYFLNYLSKYFWNIFQNPQKTYKKFQLFSSHDFNIISILNTIQAYDYRWPQFASSIFFELRNISGTPTVNIWYKNGEKFKPIVIKGCTFDCSLMQFDELLQDIYVKDEKSWNELCLKTSSDLVDLMKLTKDEYEMLKKEHSHNGIEASKADLMGLPPMYME